MVIAGVDIGGVKDIHFTIDLNHCGISNQDENYGAVIFWLGVENRAIYTLYDT